MKMGLFSVSYAGLWGQAKLDPLSFLDKAAELGFQGVLMMAKRPHLSPLDIKPDFIKAFKDRLGQHQLQCIGLAAYNDFLLTAAAEAPITEMQIAYVDACARTTAELGGELVRIFTGYEQIGSPAHHQWEQVVIIIRECADRAAEYGVKLVIQNHHTLAVDSKALNLLLLEVNRKNIRLGYDAWSPFLRSEDLYDGAKEAAPNTEITIAADYRRFKRFAYHPHLVNYTRLEPDLVKATIMGKGEVDYPAFFKGLHDGGFDQWVIYEMCSPLDGGPTINNLDLHAKSFLKYMKELKYKQN